MTRKFDRYMLVIGAGRHAKFARLTDSERCAHFLGVLSIAAQAPVRGYLLVGEEEADAAEVAFEAAVSVRVARSTIAKLKNVGVLHFDEQLGAWHIHDWSDFQLEPRKDARGDARQAAYRARRIARISARDGSRNGHEKRPEVEGEVGSRSLTPDLLTGLARA